MQIVYFYQYFTTPKGSYGTRVYEFTSEWVKKGHDVTVVTSVYAKSDIRAKGFVDNQVIDGVKLKVINVRVDNKQSFLKRIWTFIAYATVSSYYALVLPADVVIASSGPITVGLPGLVARIFRRRKLVFEVRDLWPEVVIELGVIRNKFLKFIAYKFEALCYKYSSLVVGLSPGMKKYIEDHHNHKNVISVTNAANIELFSNRNSQFEFHGLVSKKYALYTGNIGEVNNSYWLYNTAKELMKRGREDIIIVLVGDGQQSEELLKMATSNHIRNFQILGLMPKNNLVPLIQNSLVSLVPLKDTPVLDTSSPNKFFESLAAGIPVVQNTNGWMKEFLDENKVGYTLNSNDSVGLADLLIDLVDEPSKLSEIGAIASQLAKQNFDKKILADKMITAIEKVV